MYNFRAKHVNYETILQLYVTPIRAYNRTFVPYPTYVRMKNKPLPMKMTAVYLDVIIPHHLGTMPPKNGVDEITVGHYILYYTMLFTLIAGTVWAFLIF